MDEIVARLKSTGSDELSLSADSYVAIVSKSLDEFPSDAEASNSRKTGFFSYFQSGNADAHSEPGKFMARYARNNITSLSLTGPSELASLRVSPLAHLVSLSLDNVSIHSFVDLMEFGTRLTHLKLVFPPSSHKGRLMDWTDDSIPGFSSNGLAIFPSVVHLKLLNCMSKAILDNCPSCSSLDLSGNAWLDHVPPDIDRLKELVSLDMGSNSIASLVPLTSPVKSALSASPAPATTANLSRISRLSLADNYLENLQGVEQLTMLKLLDVSGNKLWGMFYY